MMLAYRRNKIQIWKSTTAERFAANVDKTVSSIGRREP